MTRQELRRRVSTAISCQLVGDFTEVDIADQIEAATSAVLAIIAALEDERVAAVAAIKPTITAWPDPSPGYEGGFHLGVLTAIKALREHGDGLTMAPTTYEALRKIVNCFDSLFVCIDEFEPHIEACAEFQQALDTAILEGKRALAELPELGK